LQDIAITAALLEWGIRGKKLPAGLAPAGNCRPL